MPDSPHSLINYLRTVAGAWRDDSRDDSELLTRFAEGKDELAFRALVWRHGALVWRTCRRILGDTPDSEDAFQSAFLALASKARKFPIKNPAGWLHQVARQAALNIDASARRRQGLEQQLWTAAKTKTKEDTDQGELFKVLDEELTSLSERFRIPLILCYLEGKSQDEVARILRCSRAAVRKRLAHGEATLRKQLERRGIALGIGSMAAILGSPAGAPAVPSHLIGSTARAAMAFRAGTLTGVTADTAEKLLRVLIVKGVVRSGWWLVLASLGFLGLGGAGMVAWKMLGGGTEADVPTTPQAAILQVVAKPSNERVDLYGDPLPDGAITRIGTVRFRGAGLGGQWSGDVALSPDGKILVSAHQHGVIRVWNADSGRQLREIAIDDAFNLSRIVFSPINMLLAATTEKGVWLFDPVAGQPIGEPLSGSWPIAFAPDGKTIAVYTNKSFTIYDIGTRTRLNVVSVEETSKVPNFTSAIFAHDGLLLACIEQSGTVHLLDIKKEKERATLKERQVVALAFMADGGKLVTAGKDKVIRFWNAKTGEELSQLGVMAAIPSLVSVLSDGKTVLSACSGQIRCWDVFAGKQMRNPLECKGLLYPSYLSVDGTKLIEKVGDTLSIWSVATGKEIGPAAGATRSGMNRIVFSPDGKNLATIGDKDSQIELWDVATGKLLGSNVIPTSLGCAYREIVWPSCNTIMTRGVYDECKIVRLMIRKDIEGTAVENMQAYPHGAKFSQDGQVLALWQGQNFKLLEVATGKILAPVPCRIKEPWEALNYLAFSADHRIMVAHSIYEPTVTLWDVSSGRELYSFNLPEHSEPGRTETDKYDRLIGFSPDGRLVVTQDPETKIVSIWEHVSGKLRLRLPMQLGDLHVETSNVVFSFDSRLLAMGCMTERGEERSIHIWDLSTGQEYQRFQGHKPGGGLAGPPQIVFSRDGRCLASAGMDYTVLIWDIKQRATLERSGLSLDQEDLQALKCALIGADAGAAYRAICKLQHVPKQAVPLAAECLRLQTPTPESKQVIYKVNRLIGELDSDDFQIRINAANELRKMLCAEKSEPVVQTALYQTLQGNFSVEVKQTVSRLLEGVKEELRWSEGARSPELTRMFRGIEVLELIHNNAACEILRKVAESPPQPEVRREAEAALKRLEACSHISTTR